MNCKECKDTGLTLIDVGAPMGSGKIEGYCSCKSGEKLVMAEICHDCGSHKDETEEKKLYPFYNHGGMVCQGCKELHLHKNDLPSVLDRLESQGHNSHCAFRMVWGDGQCECGNVFWHTTTGEELPITW